MADRRFTVVVERCGVVTLRDEQPPGPVRDGQFDVETMFSGLSTGTDLSWVKGTNPALYRSWDARAGPVHGRRTGRGLSNRQIRVHAGRQGH